MATLQKGQARAQSWDRKQLRFCRNVSGIRILPTSDPFALAEAQDIVSSRAIQGEASRYRFNTGHPGRPLALGKGTEPARGAGDSGRSSEVGMRSDSVRSQ